MRNDEAEGQGSHQDVLFVPRFYQYLHLGAAPTNIGLRLAHGGHGERSLAGVSTSGMRQIASLFTECLEVRSLCTRHGNAFLGAPDAADRVR